MNLSGAPLRAELFSFAEGPVAFPHDGEDRLVIHAGDAIRTACRENGFAFVRSRGVLDIAPSGHGAAWDAKGPSTSFMVRLAPMLLRRTAEELGIDPDRVQLEARHQFRDETIEPLAWCLLDEMRAGQPNGALFTEALSVALAVRVLRQYAVVREDTRSGLSAHRLKRITEHVEAHLADKLTLEGIARVAGVSTTHLKVWFKRETGLSVHAWVMRRRAERAARLLALGKSTASAVAFETGFAHQSHMVRTMRRVLGITRRDLEMARAPTTR